MHAPANSPLYFRKGTSASAEPRSALSAGALGGSGRGLPILQGEGLPEDVWHHFHSQWLTCLMVIEVMSLLGVSEFLSLMGQRLSSGAGTVATHSLSS